MHKCPDCGKPLHLVGPQKFITRGVVVDLMHCVTQGCPEKERTRSYNERPLPAEEIAASRAALADSIARYGAAAP